MSDAEPPDLVPQGSHEWTRVLRRVDLPATTKLVGAFAAYYATPRTGANVRPGRDRLARETGLSVKAVGTHLANLENVGMLWRVSHGSGGGEHSRLAAQYQLTVPRGVLELLEASGPDDIVPVAPIHAKRNVVLLCPRTKQEPQSPLLEKQKGT